MLKKFKLKIEESNDLKLKTVYELLVSIDLLVKTYKEEKTDNKRSILLDVFGLLQALFVGVDALYEFSYLLADNKYFININQNEILHELKFIRNDVVGHPISRKYQNNQIGFNQLNLETLKRDELSYKTYIKTGMKVALLGERKVDLYLLIDEYLETVNLILTNLDIYLKDTIKPSLINLTYNLYLNYSYKNISNDTIKLIEEEFKIANLKMDNRFIWRLELIDLAFNWKSKDLETIKLIEYITRLQLLKLHQMSADLFNKTTNLTYPKVTGILKVFYKETRKNEAAIIPLLETINDAKEPFFRKNLEELYLYYQDKRSLKLLDLIKNETDERIIYLIGSTLKRYRPLQNK